MMVSTSNYSMHNQVLGAHYKKKKGWVPWLASYFKGDSLLRCLSGGSCCWARMAMGDEFQIERDSVNY